VAAEKCYWEGFAALEQSGFHSLSLLLMLIIGSLSRFESEAFSVLSALLDSDLGSLKKTKELSVLSCDLLERPIPLHFGIPPFEPRASVLESVFCDRSENITELMII
jgi:hypothetical protein